MARFKKGSAEAKAYMASIRPGNRRKRVSRGERRVSKKRYGSRKSKRVVHVIPDALMIGGIALPAFEGINGNNSPAQELVSTHSVGDAVNYGISSYKTYWTQPVAGVAGGLILKWVGKKLGLNRIGTKEFKLF